MKKHPSEIELEAYRNRTVSPDQLLAINDHIFECDQCFRKVDSPEKVNAAYKWMKKYLEDAALDPHLGSDQIEGYLDGTLDAPARAYVSDHIEDCEDCARSLQDTEADARRRWARSKWNKLAAFLSMPGNRLALGLAIFSIVLAIVFWTREHRVNLRFAALESATARIEQNINDFRRQIESMRPDRPGGIPLALKDGNRQISVDQKGALLGFDELPENYRAALKDALTSGHIPIPPPPETSLGQKGPLLGGSPKGRSFEVISPAGTAVEETRPVFQWQRLEGAASYIVFLKDLPTGEEIQGQPTGETTWQSDKPLIRGHQFVWTVRATIDGKPVRAPAPEKPFATFRVLDEQQAQEISLARKTWNGSHLVMGLIYAKAGLTREAEKELRELVAANPESTAAKSLLASMRMKAAGARPPK